VTRYYLPNHVFFCYRGRDVAFLDLKLDEYTLLQGLQATVFQTQLVSFSSEHSIHRSAPTRGAEDANNCRAEDSTVAELIANGLLTSDARKGKPIQATRAPRPDRHLLECGSPSARSVGAGHLWHFILSCAVAAYRLRFHHIQRTVAGVSHRRASAHLGQTVDSDKGRELVKIFNALRALFPRGYLCLFDSLALLEFLARYHIYPSWIFAVRQELWGAHCWVQEGTTVFNEEIEETDEYIPIMMV
jgi:Transglutaminase-like superfamily